MAKINISFDNKNYPVDESSLSSAAAALQSHLSSVMNGTGATINLGGTAYNIDSAKLTAATNAFISHLGTVAGNGYKIMVGGVEYNVDSTKMTGAVADLNTVLGGLKTDDEDVGEAVVAGLYETGSNYTVLVKDWDTLLTEGVVHVDSGVVYTNLDMESGENTSSDALTGDLVLPNDGSITMLGDFYTVVDDSGDIIAMNGRPAFSTCRNLNSVTIPNSVTTISDAAFMTCTALTEVTIPNSVTTIGEAAFWECTALTEVTIPDGVTNIGTETFYGCTSLTEVTIPNSVTTIGEAAFWECTALTEVTIPNSVVSIGAVIFAYCDSLVSINYTGTTTQWNAITKGQNWDMYIPATYVQCSDGTVEIQPIQ
jgi:hypothetical protein